ncbi:hypothetical protein [Microbulbifer sp. 2205BS26-8]|uniref:hypothetical protein n=1 Tax=Microbulbifer sp. 2205BS26-8 TaxID=3064386 RepID=UPI0027402A7B|nr:hypothetical protein [Microbulbifer sp. 2205BS26-8]MDP5209783.1 hypothetical protein [Microbulbifer sp. 2205BS26-8]
MIDCSILAKRILKRDNKPITLNYTKITPLKSFLRLKREQVYITHGRNESGSATVFLRNVFGANTGQCPVLRYAYPLAWGFEIQGQPSMLAGSHPASEGKSE